MTLSANQQSFSLKQHVAQSKILIDFFFHPLHISFPIFEFKVIGVSHTIGFHKCHNSSVHEFPVWLNVDYFKLQLKFAIWQNYSFLVAI